jgi:hypothetical protein
VQQIPGLSLEDRGFAFTGPTTLLFRAFKLAVHWIADSMILEAV